MINDIVHATTTVYDVDPITKQLTTRKVVVSPWQACSPPTMI